MRENRYFTERNSWSFNNNKSFRETLNRNKILSKIRNQLIEKKFKNNL